MTKTTRRKAATPREGGLNLSVSRLRGSCGRGLGRGTKTVLLATHLDVIALGCSQVDHGAATVDDHVADLHTVSDCAGVEGAHGGHVVEQEADVKALGVTLFRFGAL